jgi:hypothetical protein
MRELTATEIGFVSGGTGDTGMCTPENSGNNVGGVSNFDEIGNDIIAAYEGVVQAASHIIERVANAL